MSYSIMTAEDWWTALDVEWDDVTAIVFHKIDPLHAAYETPGDAKTKPTGRTILDEMNHLKSLRTPEAGHALARYFNAAWAMASDAYAWSVPGWGAFCDLCSEEWALDEMARHA